MFQRELLGDLVRLAYETINELMSEAAGDDKARPGVVAVPQTFGSVLNVHPHSWDREHPLSVRHIRENLVLEQLGENRRSLRATRWTESPTLARECDEELEFAIRALDASETGFEQTAVKVGCHGAIPVPSPKPVLALSRVSAFPRLLGSRGLPGTPSCAGSRRRRTIAAVSTADESVNSASRSSKPTRFAPSPAARTDRRGFSRRSKFGLVSRHRPSSGDEAIETHSPSCATSLTGWISRVFH